MMTQHPARRRRIGGRAPVPSPTPAPIRPPVGSTGARVMAIGPVDAEIKEGAINGEPAVTLATFEIPGSGGVWAVVSLSRTDGSAWMVGLSDPRKPVAGGWQHDEFGGLHVAVAAVCDADIRQLMQQRTVLAAQLGELRRKADALVEALATPLPAPRKPAGPGCDE
jgi:hypothetical protein